LKFFHQGGPGGALFKLSGLVLGMEELAALGGVVAMNVAISTIDMTGDIYLS